MIWNYRVQGLSVIYRQAVTVRTYGYSMATQQRSKSKIFSMEVISRLNN